MAAISKNLAAPHVGALTAGPRDAPETLLFLHGWGGSKELWWNALTTLGEEFHAVALDLPGTGETPLTDDLRTMADFARWTEKTCRRLGLENVTLVGHSLGGNLAAQAALDCPKLVKRLVLVDAALETRKLPARAQWPLSARYGLTALRLARWASAPMAAVGRRIPHEHAGGYWLPYARRMRLYQTANTDSALQIQMRALMENPLDAEHLRRVVAPLLIVHGARDSVIPVARARALAAALPSARLVVFPNAHHCPMDTDPAGFARTLRDFCAAPP